MYTYCCLLARFSILVAQVLKLVFLFANRFTKSDWLMMFFSFFLNVTAQWTGSTRQFCSRLTTMPQAFFISDSGFDVKTRNYVLFLNLQIEKEAGAHMEIRHS